MVVAVAACLAAGCAARRPASAPRMSGAPLLHRVAPGETLYRIGQRYGVSYEKIARVNGLQDPAKIFVGQQLLIPAAHGGASSLAPAPSPGIRLTRRDSKAPSFYWPVAGGIVSSGFGQRNGAFHDGIDIAVPEGAVVQAAAAGEVAYVGTLPGYGNIIILRHRAGYATVYAHNERNHVREGQRIRRGQSIATVGRSGRTTGPNLHFEVRRENTSQDPFLFLPPGLQAGEDARRAQPGG